MVRTQVQFTDEQIRSLRRLSSASGRSVADLVREGVDRYITATNQSDADERGKRALRALGKFRSSGAGDVGVRHDRYLAEAFRK